MAFFFLMAGATSWFSLRLRTAGRYIRERVQRLLIPFIVGTIVLTPIQAYFEARHKGWWEGDSFIEFVFSAEARNYFFTVYNPITLSPEIFADLGYPPVVRGLPVRLRFDCFANLYLAEE